MENSSLMASAAVRRLWSNVLCEKTLFLDWSLPQVDGSVSRRLGHIFTNRAS